MMLTTIKGKRDVKKEGVKRASPGLGGRQDWGDGRTCASELRSERWAGAQLRQC